MFDQQTFDLQSAGIAAYHDAEPLDLREVIEDCEELPHEVKAAVFTRVEERVMSKSLLRYLTTLCPSVSSAKEWAPRLKARQSALSAYLGDRLICVFIRLPGVHYTIEIDPGEQRIVHWEWQST